MTAHQLFHADRAPTNAWHCDVCHHVKTSERDATSCCTCACGRIEAGCYGWCNACAAKLHAEQREEHKAKHAARTAQLLTTAAPFVATAGDTYAFRDDVESDDHGGFGELADLIDIAQRDPAAQGRQIVFWAASPTFARPIDVDWVVENVTQDLHDEAAETLVEVDELKAFLDAWVAKQPSLGYEPDYGRALVLTIGGAA